MENLKVTNPQLIEKYKTCTARILTEEKTNKSLEVLTNLENLDQVQKLMELVTN
jgi:hypothetical protein